MILSSRYRSIFVLRFILILVLNVCTGFIYIQISNFKWFAELRWGPSTDLWNGVHRLQTSVSFEGKQCQSPASHGLFLSKRSIQNGFPHQRGFTWPVAAMERPKSGQLGKFVGALLKYCSRWRSSLPSFHKNGRNKFFTHCCRIFASRDICIIIVYTVYIIYVCI